MSCCCNLLLLLIILIKYSFSIQLINYDAETKGMLQKFLCNKGNIRVSSNKFSKLFSCKVSNSIFF